MNINKNDPKMLLGIDLGGTKIETGIFTPDLSTLWQNRVATPATYDEIIHTLAEQVNRAIQECEASGQIPIGMGIPGSQNPLTGLIRNANSQCLNGKPLAQDLSAATGAPIRLSNDANCFAISEARDGAAAGARSVFGIIIGTGCGGALVFEGKQWSRHSGIAGEWGHNSLPWPTQDETPGRQCWCGQQNCIETWLSGPGMLAQYQAMGGAAPDVEQLVAWAQAGQTKEQETLLQYINRLARSIASVINLVDVEIVVLGGGLSNIPDLAQKTEQIVGRWVFSDAPKVRIVNNRHGDSSGIRGAALLWADETGQ